MTAMVTAVINLTPFVAGEVLIAGHGRRAGDVHLMPAGGVGGDDLADRVDRPAGQTFALGLPAR